MKVIVFPRGENPYQDLLYDEIKLLHPDDSFTYLKADYTLAPFYPVIFVVRRLQGYKIIHIHWLPFAIYFPFPFAKSLAYWYGVMCLKIMSLLGYKIVWTTHDVLPHEQHTSNDRKITQRFLDKSSAIILLSSANKTGLAEAGLYYDDEKIITIPHGNYAKSYPSSISKKSARAKMGINDKDFVFLFFGKIRLYKNIPGLIEAFKRVLQVVPSAKLIIAGEVCDPSLDEALKKAKSELDSSLIVQPRNIPANEVQDFYQACDAAVYPFNEITNSGSAILAATFGKPIIAPRIGAIADIPKGAGVFYNPSNKNALSDSMLKLAKSSQADLIKMAKASEDYSDALSWDKLGGQTYEVYDNII